MEKVMAKRRNHAGKASSYVGALMESAQGHMKGRHFDDGSRYKVVVHAEK
jgi:hypothetical protein